MKDLYCKVDFFSKSVKIVTKLDFRKEYNVAYFYDSKDELVIFVGLLQDLHNMSLFEVGKRFIAMGKLHG